MKRGICAFYCHRVASVVGLVSIEIFGCHDAQSREYALQLGLALQLTNILQDVGEDFANSGPHLPAARGPELAFTTPPMISRRSDFNEAFLALMRFEAERARGFYAAAARALPGADRRALVAAEVMHAVYRRLLEKMARDDFRVLTTAIALGGASSVSSHARSYAHDWGK